MGKGYHKIKGEHTMEDHSKELLNKGIIIFTGKIDEILAKDICEKLIYLNQRDKVDKIQMIINSGGGLTDSTFSIIDVMEYCSKPIHTIATGCIASGALMTFIAGKKGERVITPTTCILSHRHSWNLSGNYSQIIAESKENELLNKRVEKHYIKYTSLKTPKLLQKYILKDVDMYLTPEEAIEYGIADKIVKKLN